ncbi:MAG TPA: HAD-IA family hydrolase [Rhizomicrobium sp.]
MIEAVIWDFGGVFTSSPFEAFMRFEREEGLPPNIIRQINAFNHLDNAWAKFERAEIDAEGFDKAFGEEALARGHRISGREIIALLRGEIRPEMVTALRLVKRLHKTGCITNNVASMQASGGAVNAARAVMGLFDHVIESSRVGIRKPDRRIYEMMCEALEVAPRNCVYLDDIGVNLKPARDMGMTTIKVESGPQALADLEVALSMTLT